MASVFKRTSDRGNKLAPWRIKFKGADGKWHTATGCTDKVKTQQLARRLEDEAKLEREGLRDPKELRRREQASRPLSEHLEEYHAAIKAKNGSSKKNASKHADSTRTYIKWVTDTLGATKIADLTPSAVQVRSLNSSTNVGPSGPATPTSLRSRASRDGSGVTGELPLTNWPT